MSGDSKFVAPVALLCVVIDSNELPQLKGVDSKGRLFWELARLSPSELLGVLCARGKIGSTSYKRNEASTFKAILSAAARLKNWEGTSGTLILDEAFKKVMLEYLQKAQYDVEVFKAFSLELAKAAAAASQVNDSTKNTGSDEISEKSDKEIDPERAMANPSSVQIVLAGADKEDEAAAKVHADEAAAKARADEAAAKVRADEAAAKARVDEAAAKARVDEAAAKACADEVDAKDKEAKDPAGAADKTGKRWIYKGLLEILANNLAIYSSLEDRKAVDETQKVWVAGRSVDIHHRNGSPHAGVILAVGHGRTDSQPYVILKRNDTAEFEETRINKDTKLKPVEPGAPFPDMSADFNAFKARLVANVSAKRETLGKRERRPVSRGSEVSAVAPTPKPASRSMKKKLKKAEALDEEEGEEEEVEEEEEDEEEDDKKEKRVSRRRKQKRELKEEESNDSVGTKEPKKGRQRSDNKSKKKNKSNKNSNNMMQQEQPNLDLFGLLQQHQQQHQHRHHRHHSGPNNTLRFFAQLAAAAAMLPPSSSSYSE